MFDLTIIRCFDCIVKQIAILLVFMVWEASISLHAEQLPGHLPAVDLLLPNDWIAGGQITVHPINGKMEVLCIINYIPTNVTPEKFPFEVKKIFTQSKKDIPNFKLLSEEHSKDIARSIIQYEFSSSPTVNGSFIEVLGLDTFTIFSKWLLISSCSAPKSEYSKYKAVFNRISNSVHLE